MLADIRRWTTRLLASGVSMLPAAYYAALAQGSAHDQALAAELSALAGGLGGLLINQLSASLTETKNSELSERNHLVRRGMTRALHDALKRAEKDLKSELPAELRDDLFAHWLGLL